MKKKQETCFTLHETFFFRLKKKQVRLHLIVENITVLRKVNGLYKKRETHHFTVKTRFFGFSLFLIKHRIYSIPFFFLTK